MNNDLIINKMLQELSSFKYIYSETIDWCFETVCKMYGIEGDKEEVISSVRDGLTQLFS